MRACQMDREVRLLPGDQRTGRNPPVEWDSIDAKFDKAPVIAVTGLPYHDLIDTFTQQDVDLGKLFSDVAAY